MKETLGTTGLVFNEPLLWEKGKKGRSGFSLPRRDVAEHPVDKKLEGPGPDFPDLSEVDVVRHFIRLSQWNFSVDSGMYPLGSCTMKYNPKTNEVQSARPGLVQAHPLLPQQLSQGALKLMYELEQYLTEITGMDATSLQPAAGAHGELTGMLLIYAYLKSKGTPRSKILVPDTAHGTNPASVAMSGFEAVEIPSDERGNVDLEALKAVCDETVVGLMLTNPNTLGLFEEEIVEVIDTLARRYGVRQFLLGELDFFTSQRRAVSTARELLARGPRVSWFALVSPIDVVATDVHPGFIFVVDQIGTIWRTEWDSAIYFHGIQSKPCWTIG